MSSNLRRVSASRHAQDRGVQVDVVAAGQLGVEAGPGRDQAGDPAPGQHLAAVGSHDPVDHLQQRALARAVQAHQPDRLALLDGERHVVDGQERVRELLLARHRDAHLLEGAVVAQRERLGDVAYDDRLVGPAHSSRSGIRRSRRENVDWAMTRTTRLISSARRLSRNRFGRHVDGRRTGGVGRGTDPERPLEVEHRLGDRVQQVEVGVAVEPHLRPARRGTSSVRRSARSCRAR